MKVYDVYISFYRKSEWGNNKCFEIRRISAINEREAKEDSLEEFKTDNPFNVSGINIYDTERYVGAIE